MKFSHDGALLMTVGEKGVPGEDETHFNQPTDVAVAPSGEFYVSDGYGNNRVARFSRDGNWITFVRSTAGIQNIWLMRSDGSAKRIVRKSSYDELNPAISPEGRHVVYSSVRGGAKPESQLYLARVADGLEIQLTRNGQNGRPVW